jgi:GTP cyclohydrolase IA
MVKARKRSGVTEATLEPERPAPNLAKAAAAIDDFLRALGHDPGRNPDLKGTGERVAAAFAEELLAGYREDPVAALLRELIPVRPGEPTVIVRNVPVATMCPHHLLPAQGKATIAYQPARLLAGIGAIAKLATLLAKRLSLQETLNNAIVSELDRALKPAWLACTIHMTHGCMVLRGEHAYGTSIQTWKERGNVPDAMRQQLMLAAGSP